MGGTAGQLTATTDNGRTLTYAYADKINRTRITWPDGYSADYAYDNLNRVTTIRENGAAILASYAYDTSGRRASVTLGNGAVTSYGYYQDDALNSLSHNMGGTASDVNWNYGFNKVNQLTSKIIGGGANLSFYQWQPQAVKTDAYTSNGLNQYSAVAGANLSYDTSGNLTSDGVWNYVYDTENMLLNASKPGTSASYIYDPLGRRSAKSVNGILTTFLHDGVEEIADYNSSGTLLRRYVHGPDVDEYLVMYTGTGTANKSYFHANHQGSIIAMSNASGTVTEQHSYDSYGNSATLTGAPFRYTGRRLDAETGLYYYRARYYSPAIGRFLQTDPIGYGDGLNRYAYVGNDPVNGVDPSGEQVIEEIVVTASRTPQGRVIAFGTLALMATTVPTIRLASISQQMRLGNIRFEDGFPPILNNEDVNNEGDDLIDDESTDPNTKPQTPEEEAAIKDVVGNNKGRKIQDADKMGDSRHKGKDDKWEGRKDGNVIHYWKDRTTGKTFGGKIKGRNSTKPDS